MAHYEVVRGFVDEREQIRVVGSGGVLVVTMAKSFYFPDTDQHRAHMDEMRKLADIMATALNQDAAGGGATDGRYSWFNNGIAEDGRPAMYIATVNPYAGNYDSPSLQQIAWFPSNPHREFSDAFQQVWSEQGELARIMVRALNATDEMR